MSVLNNRQINIINNSCFKLIHPENTQNNALWLENDQGGRNDFMLEKFFCEFSEIKNILQNNS